MQKPAISAPIATPRPKILEAHQQRREDPYYWLRERDNPEVLEYLQAENTYQAAMMQSSEKLQEELFQEIKGRIVEDDQSVPYFKKGYWYYLRYEQGQEHPIYCRKKETLEQAEEILLDVNQEAQGHSYFQAGGLSISPDGQWMAYGIDTVGRRIYRIKLRHLPTRQDQELELENTTGYAVWSNDGQYLFYTVKDEALRPFRIMRHRIGSAPAQDIVLFTERNETFVCSIAKSKSEAYLVVGCHSTVSNEYHCLSANEPTGALRLFQARERHLEYSIAHYEDHWYVVTNKDGATNFKLMRCPLDRTEKQHWQEVLGHREDVLLEDMELFREHLVLAERKNGLVRLRLRRWDNRADKLLEWPEETYVAGLGHNPDYDSPWLRYQYSSLTTPGSVYDYEFSTGKHHLRKQQKVVGGHQPEEYASERQWATAPDGTKIPISLVYHKESRRAEGNPLLLYGYGAYGITVSPGFSVSRLSLLQRGWIFAIAHVRGGQYLGRPWYEAGRLLHKKNTFSDFIACGEHLQQHGYAAPERLYAMGGSAGGLLVGAAMNMRPNLFRAVVAAVPFVDVLTTMLDDSIPLTTGEYDEWGNPQEKAYYDYIESYSPYDQVQTQDYPALLVTAGLHDSQVQYWEPAKWVARLRARKTDDQPVLLRTQMEAGHGGKSGRFESLREVALEYAFLLDVDADKNSD